MPTFIKTGFWEKLSKAPKEYLNLDNLIQSIGGGGGTSYKKYVALISQSGTDDPVVTEVYNSLGVSPISWIYNGTGSVAVNFPVGTFDTMKTVSTISQDDCNGCTFLSAAQNSETITINKYLNGSPSSGLVVFITVTVYQ